MSQTLSDTTVFITGGPRGIRRATALKPASAGCIGALAVDGGCCISG
jgi:NAD(P)-dependent dehydrogenase (short-subunit alcohol dehydrogenase family)